MDPMAAIRETFFQECDEQLGELETGLIAIENGDTDPETINAVFRAVHSIKGGAGAFRLDALVRFSHIFETVLDRIRNGQLAPTPAVLKTMLRSADVLADLVHAARNGESIDESAANSLSEDLHAWANASSNPAEEAKAEDDFGFQPMPISLSEPVPALSASFAITLKPAPELYLKGNETARLLRDLGRLGEIVVRCETAAIPLLTELDPLGSYTEWHVDIATTHDLSALQEVFDFVDGDCELTIREIGVEVHDAIEPELASAERDHPIEVTHPDEIAEEASLSPLPKAEPAKADPAKASSSQQATIRVDLERVDRLINLVGELVINQAMLSQRMLEAGMAKGTGLTAGLDELEQLTRDIQESVMAIRAQPVKPLFQRMARIVREVADATGKTVRLVTEGDTTEVDRTVIERLADPLTHMIRNAVDHGLETTEKRRALGKSEQGEVRLSAAHRSGRIIIEVADDGAGINRPRVKEIAIKKGLIEPDAQLSDIDIDNLLFLPGFSTSQSVSAISGRGVGMDVVKRSIQAVGGRITIASRPGLGSTFSMSLPLTLAVLDGMVAKVGEQTLVLPLTAIVETMKPKPTDVHAIGPEASVLANRGGFIPIIDVGTELGYRARRVDPVSAVAILVEAESGARSALIVDAIHDQRQVVIKSLEANYGQVRGIAAATILGDGRIALILDIDAIVAGSSRNGAASDTKLFAAG